MQRYVQVMLSWCRVWVYLTEFITSVSSLMLASAYRFSYLHAVLISSGSVSFKDITEIKNIGLLL